MQNKFKKAVAEKGYAVGTFLGVTTPAILEAISYSGLDYVVIDTEHGTYDMMPMSDMISTASQFGMCPMVRVSDPTHKEIQHALDNGAEGIIVPCLRDIEDFKKVVEYGKFAPIGERGFIKGRGSGFGNEAWASGDLASFMKASNEKVMLLPQCETKEALEHIEEIVNMEGVDGIVMGPFDLSICLGIPGQFDKPEFKAAVDRILAACKAAGKPCLSFNSTVEEARESAAKGFEGVAISIDTIVYADAYRKLVSDIRA